MKSVVITRGVRTAIGKLGGRLKDVLPEDLAATVIQSVIGKSSVNVSEIDKVILGQTKQSSDCPNIARIAALKAGLPEETPAYTLHMQCASGMQSIVNAVWQIQTGNADLIVAGGVESMSTAPYYMRNARFGYMSGNGALVDPNTESQLKSQPEEVYGKLNMGLTAENLADIYNITRKAQDEFAFLSQQKALQAIDNRKFQEEITPIKVKMKREEFTFNRDEYPRRDTSLEKLSRLRPVFKENGTVTAGNSSGRNDGAAAVLVMSEEKARELDIRPMIKFISAGISGINPKIMGIGPVPATMKALKKSGLTMKDIGLIELNEAFAAQCLAVISELELNTDILNVNGGAIALGHPLGCSGTRITVTLMYEMLRRQIKYGLATICVAGGLGVTTIYENLDL